MNFDSYYDPPDDPPIPPESEEASAILEEAGVGDAVIEKICKIIETLADQVVAAGECGACERRMLDDQAKAEEEMANYQPLPDDGQCVHGIQYIDCSACAYKEDLAYDAMREKR